MRRPTRRSGVRAAMSGGMVARMKYLAPLALLASVSAWGLELHYAPRENLAQIDCGLIDDSVDSVDMEAYVLSDQSVIAALIAAADRGVVLRLYLDKGQFSQHDPERGGLIEELLGCPNVFARVKGKGVLMHLKAYVVDRRVLRTGSGNFSRPGLADQDNDLVIVDDTEAIANFEAKFDAIFARGTNVEAMGMKVAGGRR